MNKRKVPKPFGFRLGLFARTNLYITVVVVAVLVLVCILLTNSLVYPGIQKDKVLNEEAVNQLATLFANKYASVFNQSKLLHTQEHVAERIVSFQRSGEEFFSLEDIRFFNSYLTAVRYADEDILDAVIIPIKSSNVFFTSARAARRMRISFADDTLPVIQELIHTDQRIRVTYSSVQDYLVPGDTELVTFAIKIFNPDGIFQEDLVGVMLINYPLSVFSDAYRKLGTLSGGDVYALNRENTIFFSTSHELLGTSFDPALEENAEVTTRTISTSGIQLVSIMPLDALHSATMNMIRLLIRILLPAMLLIVTIILLCNYRYRRRLDDLSAAMQSYTSTFAQTPISIRHHDELAMLATQFNEMCQRLDQQIKMQYQAEVARKTAELNALQAQINPHFLYNTIESIRMRAVEEGNLDVSEMLMQLGQMFHWMIQLDKRIVYLEDELDYNEAYLDLQKLRYENSFDSEFQIPDDTLYLGVPKFTLQPIIENALLHGLKENGLQGTITLTASVHQQTLTLQVADNGSGMDADTLSRLQQHIAGAREYPDFGIGIRNVHTRIRMLFGDGYGVTVQSQLHAGTVVTVTLPACEKKVMEHMAEQDMQPISGGSREERAYAPDDPC